MVRSLPPASCFLPCAHCRIVVAMDPPGELDLCDGDSPTSIRRRPVPTVLVVGCSQRFAARCREALELSGAAVVECGVAAYKTVATRVWPPVIVMTETLFAFDPDGFTEIALALGSILLRVESEDVSSDELTSLLVPSVFQGAKRQEALER
jgi:hypothetical protein